MFAQESLMDIKKLRQEFEKLPDIKGILYGSEFGFNESLNEYYHPDHTNHRLNYAFIMGAWMAWKAQTVPEGFVLVDKHQLAQLMANMDSFGKKALGDDYVSFADIAAVLDEAQDSAND